MIAELRLQRSRKLATSRAAQLFNTPIFELTVFWHLHTSRTLWNGRSRSSVRIGRSKKIAERAERVQPPTRGAHQHAARMHVEYKRGDRLGELQRLPNRMNSAILEYSGMSASSPTLHLNQIERLQKKIGIILH